MLLNIEHIELVFGTLGQLVYLSLCVEPSTDSCSPQSGTIGEFLKHIEVTAHRGEPQVKFFAAHLNRPDGWLRLPLWDRGQKVRWAIALAG
jgi:hypothetical protein